VDLQKYLYMLDEHTQGESFAFYYFQIKKQF